LANRRFEMDESCQVIHRMSRGPEGNGYRSSKSTKMTNQNQPKKTALKGGEKLYSEAAPKPAFLPLPIMDGSIKAIIDNGTDIHKEGKKENV